MSRRLGAIVAILGGAIALAAGAYAFVTDFPRGLIVFACVFGALGAAWYGLLRRGWRRWTGAVLALLLAVIAVATSVSGENAVALGLVVIAFLAGLAGARRAFRPERSLPRAPPPCHPVLFVNPWSGDGAAARAGLVEEAGRRGMETVVLDEGDSLEELVRAAVGRGADGLAMAGGDGSQALVAAIAAEHDLPYACIPSGTRNHFALDLGVDREDVAGALDAFVDGGERYVDLGEVNGRVFVNNVSLGVYAQAVGQEQYRESKLRTLLETMTDTLGPEAEAMELRWSDADGNARASTALILVSNDEYLLGPTLGTGTRPRLDAGVLGIVDFHPPTPGGDEQVARWRQLSAPGLEVEADGPIPLGIDGEAVTLESPLRFRSRRRALRVRIAADHPGASPSAELPHGPLSILKELLRVALRGE
ncbi:MAG TPA: diacylglycerol kinase family protein [Solirubrobacterales bacterium]|jgi:diacylglycerol kinase family enzyme|nr:diacylglycerol kinase family protein [Solirubrobacterales bacterium]